MRREVPTAGGALRLSPVSRQSASRRCGTNRSCACVAIVVIRVGVPVSQAEEQMDADEGRQNAMKVPSGVLLRGSISTRRTKNVDDDDGLPVEAHLEIGCVLGTGERGDGFSLLGHQLKHLQQS